MARWTRLTSFAAVFLLAFPASTLAAERWAVVTAAGVLDRGNGTQSSTKTAEGSYTVVFSAKITGCTYQATVGSHIAPKLATGRPPGGLISVAPLFGNPSALRVVTRDRTGTLKSRGFHLLVACPSAQARENPADAESLLSDADRWGVVSIDSVVAGRGATSAALIPLDTGNRGTEVLFDKEVRPCAYLASEVIPSSEHDPYLLGVGPRYGKSRGVHVSSALTSTAGPAGEFSLVVKCPGSVAQTGNDRSAVVNANGSLARGVGVLDTGKLGTGRYFVSIDKRRFGWRGAGRAWLLTIGNASALLRGLPAGVATLELWGEATDTSVDFLVQTWKPNPENPGDLIGADLPFHFYAVAY
jgi:hypothetical protein